MRTRARPFGHGGDGRKGRDRGGFSGNAGTWDHDTLDEGTLKDDIPDVNHPDDGMSNDSEDSDPSFRGLRVERSYLSAYQFQGWVRRRSDLFVGGRTLAYMSA